MHYVVEIVIRRVANKEPTPINQRGVKVADERVIEEVSRVVTRGNTLAGTAAAAVLAISAEMAD